MESTTKVMYPGIMKWVLQIYLNVLHSKNVFGIVGTCDWWSKLSCGMRIIKSKKKKKKSRKTKSK